jgi:hypothetical protein
VSERHYATPEDAARGDIPARFARVLDIAWSPRRDRAVVLLETNEPPSVELYQVVCQQEEAGWTWISGGNGPGETSFDEVRVTTTWEVLPDGSVGLSAEWRAAR